MSTYEIIALHANDGAMSGAWRGAEAAKLTVRTFINDFIIFR